MVISIILVIIFSGILFSLNLSKNFVDDELYPVEAVKYIKENIDVNKMRIFNEYDFGSYLLLHDIPVFVDSRADLYTSPYSGLDYDILDDYHNMFENLLEQYQKLPIDSKREKNIEEMKLVLAMLQLLCEKRNIKYQEIKVPEETAFNDEDDYLDSMYTYITAIKEELGSYVLEIEKNN